MHSPMFAEVVADLPNPTEFDQNLTRNANYLTSPMFVLPLLIVILAVLALVAFTYLVIQNKKPADALRGCGVILIIAAALLLVAGGYGGSSETSTVIGLLGTVAGYLLGRQEARTAEHEAPSKPQAV